MDTQLLSMGYGGRLRLHPNGKKFVAVTDLGVILEIFSINDDKSINRTVSKYYSFPKFEMVPYGEALSLVFDKDNKFGYQDVKVDSDYIYTLFSESTLGEYENDPADPFKSLLIYDWNGEPVQRFDLEVPITGFDIAKNVLYGVVIKPEPRIVKYKLPKL